MVFVVEVVTVLVVVLVVDEVVVVGGFVEVVTVVVVVLDAGTLAAFAGSEPASSSVRSRKPSSSRSIPIRTPLPGGTAVYVSSCPVVAACPCSVTSLRRGSLARSLWNCPALGW